jgi:uncharacterized protein (UPF0303 family)
MLDDIYGQEEDEEELARDIFVPGQENNFAASQKNGVSSNNQQYLRRKPNKIKGQQLQS